MIFPAWKRTQYRGFEQNIQDLVKEVKERGNVILFFDETNRFWVPAAWATAAAPGMSDILKPALPAAKLP